jgi:hypothetical protein
VGIELGLMNDRLLFSASYYNNHSSNQLVGYPLPLITGFGSIQQNLPALVQNTGVEFTLNYAVIKTSSFNWNLSANLTIPDNKLVSFHNIDQTSYNVRKLEAFKYLSILSIPECRSAGGVINFQAAWVNRLFLPFSDDLKAIKKVAASYYM